MKHLFRLFHSLVLRSGPSIEPEQLDRAEFALWLKRHRYRLQMTQAELGDRVGVHRVTILHWENGTNDARPKRRNLHGLEMIFWRLAPKMDRR